MEIWGGEKGEKNKQFITHSMKLIQEREEKMTFLK